MSREYGPTKVRSESCDFSSIRSRDDAGDPIPDRSLRPLLPSVQILFDFFFQSRTRSHPAPDITTPAKLARHISQPKPLLPLLPSVQILFPASVTSRIGP